MIMHHMFTNLFVIKIKKDAISKYKFYKLEIIVFKLIKLLKDFIRINYNKNTIIQQQFFKQASLSTEMFKSCKVFNLQIVPCTKIIVFNLGLTYLI